MEQRDNEWMRVRLGKMTASEISVLMNDRTEKMTDEELAEYKAANPKSRVTTKKVPFNDSTYTYLNRVVMENYLPIKSDSVESMNMVDEYLEQHAYSSRATEHGVFWEDRARQRYSEIMGKEVIEVAFVPYRKYPNLAGASPDGLVREDRGGLEIKCPFTLDKHLKHCLYSSANELFEEEPAYYWQCYMNMLVTDCEYWDFVSFCPYVSESKQVKILRIPREEEQMELLKSRIDLAAEYIKYKFNELEETEFIVK